MHLISIPLGRLAGLLVLALLGTSCQSARTAFQFRPPGFAPPPAQVPAGGLAAPELAPSAESQFTRAAAVAHAAVAPRRGNRPASLLKAGARRQLAALAPADLATGRAASTRSVAATRLQRFRAALLKGPHRPALAPAENGLGTTFLGILGIVALLVGLVGLIFAGWGFFGWLAAGGAVALLISILVPFLTGG